MHFIKLLQEERKLESCGLINQFTAAACEISGLKGAHTHTCKEHIWWPYEKSAFNSVRFGGIRSRADARKKKKKKKKKEEKASRFQIVDFYWSFSSHKSSWQWKD